MTERIGGSPRSRKLSIGDDREREAGKDGGEINSDGEGRGSPLHNQRARGWRMRYRQQFHGAWSVHILYTKGIWPGVGMVCGCGRGNGEGGEVRESVAVLGVLLCCVTTKQLELVTAAACGAAAAAAEGDE